MHCLYCCRHSVAVAVVRTYLHACPHSRQQVLTLCALARHCTVQEGHTPAEDAVPAPAAGAINGNDDAGAGVHAEVHAEVEGALALQEQEPAAAQNQGVRARFGVTLSAAQLLALVMVGAVLRSLLRLCCELWLGWASKVCKLQ
jgi:hypothetical protein